MAFQPVVWFVSVERRGVRAEVIATVHGAVSIRHKFWRWAGRGRTCRVEEVTDAGTRVCETIRLSFNASGQLNGRHVVRNLSELKALASGAWARAPWIMHMI